MAEVEAQASEFWENLKQEEQSLRQLIKNYQENYISHEEHASVLS